MMSQPETRLDGREDSKNHKLELHQLLTKSGVFNRYPTKDLPPATDLMGLENDIADTPTARQTTITLTNVLTHSAIRPIGQWDAIAGWDGPFTNRTSERPIEQWAQPIHQSAQYSGIITSYETPASISHSASAGASDLDSTLHSMVLRKRT